MKHLAIGLVLMVGACSSGRTETHAVGSIHYEAAPQKCEVTNNDGVLVVHADHYKAKDGKGVVFEAVKPGKATVTCGDSKTTIAVREAVSLELRRSDGANTPAKVDSLYAPGFCAVAKDKDGKELEIGYHTDGVEFTTSDHLNRIVDHGMGGPGPGAACLGQHGTQKAGTASIAVSWKGMTAKASLEIQ